MLTKHFRDERLAWEVFWQSLNQWRISSWSKEGLQKNPSTSFWNRCSKTHIMLCMIQGFYVCPFSPSVRVKNRVIHFIESGGKSSFRLVNPTTPNAPMHNPYLWPMLRFDGICEQLGISRLGNKQFQGYKADVFISRSSFQLQQGNLQHAWTYMSNHLLFFCTCQPSYCWNIEVTCYAPFVQGETLVCPHVHLLSYPTNITKNT